MNRSKQSTDGAEHHGAAAVNFVQAAVDLRDSASLVVALGRSGIRKSLIELDDGSGNLQRSFRSELPLFCPAWEGASMGRPAILQVWEMAAREQAGKS